MNDVHKAFEKIAKKFQEKRKHFTKIIQQWKEKGRKELHEQAKHLFDDAERLLQELKQDTLVTAEGSVDKATLKVKVKKFKSIFKELNEATKPIWRQWIEAILIALALAIILRHTIFSPYHVPTGSAEPNILVGDRIWGNKMAYYFNKVKCGDLVIFDDPQHVYTGNFFQQMWQRYIGIPLPLFGLKSGPMNVVKRVVGQPGDIVEGKIEKGRPTIYLNGNKLEEPYVNIYPLIAIRKTTGFFNFGNVGPIGIPTFLRQETKICNYTYVPELDYADQPYYNIDPASVVHKPGTNKPMLNHAFTPIYHMKLGHEEFFSVDTFGPLKLPEDAYWVMGDSRKNSADSRYWGPLRREFIRGRASFILFSIDSEEAFWLFDLIKNPIRFWTKHVRWNRCFKSLSNNYEKVAISGN